MYNQSFQVLHQFVLYSSFREYFLDTFLLVHLLVVKLHQGESVLDEFQLVSELNQLLSRQSGQHRLHLQQKQISPDSIESCYVKTMCQYVYISTAAVMFWNETLIVPSTRCLGTESPAPRGARDPETHQTASHSERPPSSLNQTLLSLLSAAPRAPSPPSTPKGGREAKS